MTEVYIPVALQRDVKNRGRGCCEYCGTPSEYFPDIFEFEHIIPRSAQGETKADNLAFTCAPCNRFKGARTTAVDPQKGRRVALFNPRRQKWERHFTWSDDGTEVIGRTATGRATVAALHKNRQPLKNLRAMLLLAGVHPTQHND